MQLSFIVGKNKRRVAEILTSPNEFVAVHPLIFDMRHIGGNQYMVFESVRLAGLPYRFAYDAEVTKADDDTWVQILANVRNMVRIEMTFRLSDHGQGTQIDETVSIKSVLPVKAMMNKLLSEQHGVLFKNIDES